MNILTIKSTIDREGKEKEKEKRKGEEKEKRKGKRKGEKKGYICSKNEKQYSVVNNHWNQYNFTVSDSLNTS